MKFLKSLFIIGVAASLLTGCANDDNYGAPEIVGTELPVTKSIQEIFAVATTTAAIYEGDDVIEGYVASSDQGENFYKSISFQALDGSIGFSIPINLYNTYADFKPGRKVYVKLKGRHIIIQHGGLIIGSAYEGGVGRLSYDEYKNTIIPSNTIVDEEQLVQRITIQQALNNSRLNTLIEVDNAQFLDAAVGKTLYTADNAIGGATNHNIIDINGSTAILRTSSFANFANFVIPSNSGKIRGVMTKYNSDFQFLARTVNDIQLTEERFTVDLFPAIVGNAITFSGNFTENFESYGTTSPANRNFPKYINDAAVGSRYWSNTAFGGNKYIQMTSFGGTPEANRTLFIVPVDMTAANNFSFQTKAGFANGAVLKVYYTTNYVPGGDINDATLVNITSNFTISPGLPSGYPATFTNSGVYAIPASVTGNGFFVFEYVGSGGAITTTMQIDNIVVN